MQVGTRQRRYPQCMIYKSIAAQDGLKEDLLAQAVSPKTLRFIEAGCEAGKARSDFVQLTGPCPHTTFANWGRLQNDRSLQVRSLEMSMGHCGPQAAC